MKSFSTLLQMLVLISSGGCLGLNVGRSKMMTSMGPLSKSLPPLKVPSGFRIPDPKPLSVTQSKQLPAVATGALALALRGASGATTFGWAPAFGEGNSEEYALKLGFISLKDENELVKSFKKPTKSIILYEYEASPFCRKVREACSILDLTVSIKPCPARATGFREELSRIGSKIQVPYMVDVNTGESLYESEDIIAYLFDNYGPGRNMIPWSLKGQFSTYTSALASRVRGQSGAIRRPNAKPENFQRKELELWGYEGSPFVKPVREVLSELELPHKFIFCARGSSKRNEMLKKTGRFQVPYLVDPNTGIEMFESIEIAEYLNVVYTNQD